MKSIKLSANAKINLFLDIVSRRGDGYHDIISVMQSVSLCDTVNIEYDSTGRDEILLSCSVPHLTSGADNTAYRAAELFGAKGNVKIHIEKNIPMAAGLAGGSADAAAVLYGLNILVGNKKSPCELDAIAAKIGADVPFCLHGGTLLTEGIGEKLTGFSPLPDCFIVIAKKGEGVSTPMGYKMLDERYDNFENYRPRTDMLEKLRGEDKFSGMFNIFEEVILPIRPEAAEVKQTILSVGADFAMMSGSGPSVFGIFSDENKSLAAVDKLRDMGAEAHACRPMGQGVREI